MTTTFSVPTREQVSTNNQVIFDNLQKALGFVPNLYATIAYSKNKNPTKKNKYNHFDINLITISYFTLQKLLHSSYYVT